MVELPSGPRSPTRWQWRKPHESGALGRATRERGAAPSSALLDGQPARIPNPVARRPGHERPYPGPGRLQRRSIQTIGAPLAPDPRRSQSGRGNAIVILNPIGVVNPPCADHHAEAYPNADRWVEANRDTDTNPDADGHANNPDAHPNSHAHPDPNAYANPATHPDPDADPDPAPYAHP